MAKDDKFVNSSSQDNFTTEKVNVISNCLLGDYVEDEYFISDDIIAELVEVVKVKKSVYKNSVFCSAFIAGYGDVVFEVTFQKNSIKNVAMAELFVLENEYKINGYIQNTIRTKVSEFIDDLDNFIEKAYDFFHIVLTEDGGRDYNLKEDISMNAYINAKRSFNLNMAKLTSKEYNKLYKNYVTARLEALKGTDNEFSKIVLDKFNGEFSKIEKYFLKDNNYKALSELLDKCIEDCTGVNPKFKQQEKEVMDKLTPIVDDFSKQADVIYEHAQPKAMDNLNKAEKTRMEEIERDNYEAEQKFKEIEARTKKESASVLGSKPSYSSSSDSSRPTPTPRKEATSQPSTTSINVSPSAGQRSMVDGQRPEPPTNQELLRDEYNADASHAGTDWLGRNNDGMGGEDGKKVRSAFDKNPDTASEKSPDSPPPKNAEDKSPKPTDLEGFINPRNDKKNELKNFYMGS